MAKQQQKQQRLREAAAHYNSGLAAPLSDEELLVLVLSPAGRPTQRMVRIAHRIMRTCGLQGFAEELTNAPVGLGRFGLSLPEVDHLKMMYELVERCNQAHTSKTLIRDEHDAAKVFRPAMMHLDHEEIHVISLNNAGQIVEYARIYKGTVDEASLRTAEIFRPALLRNCPQIIMAHNHPSSDLTPSPVT